MSKGASARAFPANEALRPGFNPNSVTLSIGAEPADPEAYRGLPERLDDFLKKERHMNRDTLKGQWMQLKGKMRRHWGRLTDDELDKMQGNAEMLIGKIQEVYGKTREQAEKELDNWLEQPRQGGQPQAAGAQQFGGGQPHQPGGQKQQAGGQQEHRGGQQKGGQQERKRKIA